MTAARRGRKVCFPPTVTPTVAKLPLPQGGAVRPTLSHASTIPAGAPSVPTDGRLNADRERPATRFHPSATVSSGASPSYSRRSSISCLRGFWDLGAHGFVGLFHCLTTDTFANALEG